MEGQNHNYFRVKILGGQNFWESLISWAQISWKSISWGSFFFEKYNGNLKKRKNGRQPQKKCKMTQKKRNKRRPHKKKWQTTSKQNVRQPINGPKKMKKWKTTTSTI